MNTSATGEARTLADQSEALNRFGALFHAQFRSMQTLATFLGADDPEDVASEAFVRLYQRRHRMTEAGAEIAYRRATVVNLCRSRVRTLRWFDVIRIQHRSSCRAPKTRRSV